MTENNDIERDHEDTALKLTSKARQHSVRISQNATDSPIKNTKFRNFKVKDDNGSVV